jgi:hypothetical protein
MNPIMLVEEDSLSSCLPPSINLLVEVSTCARDLMNTHNGVLWVVEQALLCPPSLTFSPPSISLEKKKVGCTQLVEFRLAVVNTKPCYYVHLL